MHPAHRSVAKRPCRTGFQFHGRSFQESTDDEPSAAIVHRKGAAFHRTQNLFIQRARRCCRTYAGLVGRRKNEQEAGAEEGTRTPTPLRVHGPEPCASANSATSARRDSADRSSHRRDSRRRHAERAVDSFYSKPRCTASGRRRSGRVATPGVTKASTRDDERGWREASALISEMEQKAKL